MSNVTQLGVNNGGSDAVTAVGTTLSGAAALTGGFNTLTTSAGQVAVTLPNKGDLPTYQPTVVFVSSATAATVFPPSATAQINSLGAGNAFSVAQNKPTLFFQISALQYVAVLSA